MCPAVSVELVDARDRTRVWGARYNRRASDLPAVLSDIPGEIAETLGLRQTDGAGGGPTCMSPMEIHGGQNPRGICGAGITRQRSELSLLPVLSTFFSKNLARPVDSD